jgi:D-alanyl-D-alanine carboxypeptidase/D-alanyl-D-alanine-endopeptidase (penicillin-binding protein 4)
MNYQLNLKKRADELKVRLLKRRWLTHSVRPLFLGFFFLVPFIASAASLESLLQTVQQYGYDPAIQSFCAEQDGISLVSYRSDAQMVPASVSKLYVTDWALSVRDPSFRYQTKFYLSNGTLSIVGGKDPQFVQDDLKRVFAALSKTERSKIKKIVFDRNVIFNWQTLPQGIGIQIAQVSKKYFGRTIQVRYSPLLIFQSKTRMTLFSPPLHRILKEMNVYSNNSTADSIFIELGGASEFKNYLSRTYGALAHDASFGVGSGTHDNMTTCRLTLAVTKHLHQKIQTLGMQISDLLVIPGVDKGSNRTRFKDVKTAVAVKTGYVWHAHTVAGILNARSGPVYFAVFTYDAINPQVPRGASLVDALVSKMAENYSRITWPYSTPDYNTLDERVLK